MSGQGGGQEKTERATPTKLREARSEGRVPRSPDLGSWAAVGAVGALVPWTVSSATDRLGGLVRAVEEVTEAPEPGTALRILADGFVVLALLVAPLALVGALAVVLLGSLQGGLVVAPKALAPKWRRLDPVQGVKDHYGPQAGWQAVQIGVKTAALVLVTWMSVQSLVPILIGSGALPLSSSLGAARSTLIDLVVVSTVVGLVLGVADHVVKRRKHARDLRMTKQEVKDELKRTEGDPLVKSARRSRAMALSRNRMMRDVATADAVVVNPTHVAVAVRYDPERGAPRVVAKGSGHLARRIRARAGEHGVPLVADIPLARALYRTCRLGQEIPPELYGAVAHVLAFLLALRRTGRRRPDGPLVVPGRRAA